MLEAAESANWEKIEIMESQRQTILKNLVATIDSFGGEEHPIDVVSEHLREVLVLNNRLIDLGLQAKVNLAEIMGNIQRGRKAVNVYYGMK
jgi:hypothetical protein